MEIDVEKFKALLRHFTKPLKAFDTELSAYRTVFHAMKVSLGLETQLEEALVLARNSAQLRQQMDQKYDANLEKFLARIDQVAIDQGLEEWLRNWKLEGPTN
jgi:hypothetical protein